MSERHGSLGEEAVRLVDAIQQRFRDSGAFSGGSGGDDVWGQVTDDVTAQEQGSPECRICPFCQGLHLVRTARPEVFAHLMSASHSFAAALRDLVDTREHAGNSRRSSGVEHIDIG